MNQPPETNAAKSPVTTVAQGTPQPVPVNPAPPPASAPGSSTAKAVAAPSVPPAPTNPVPAAIVDLRRPDSEQVHTAPGPWQWIIGPVLGILLPTIVIIGYLAFWATPAYTSTATVALKSTALRESVGITIAAGLGIGTGAADDRILEKQIESLHVAVEVDRMCGVRRHWQDPENDVIFRLAENATNEDYLEHYRGRVSVSLDVASGLVSIGLQAYEPQFAQRALTAVVSAAEEAVNQATRQLVAERLKMFSEEVERTRRELDAATAAILAFQSVHRLADAKGQAVGIGGLLAGIESQLATERTALAEQLSLLGDGHPEVVGRRARMEAIIKERDRFVSELVGVGVDPDPAAINRLVARQAALDYEIQRATASYTAAVNAREMAKVEASHKLKHLVVIDPPTLPEEHSHPRTIYWGITSLIVFSLIYAVIMMTITTIREHRD